MPSRRPRDRTAGKAKAVCGAFADRDVHRGIACECGLDLRHPGHRNERVTAAVMQAEPAANPVRLGQMAVDVRAVEGHGHIRIGARRRQVSELPAGAISDRARVSCC